MFLTRLPGGIQISGISHGSYSFLFVGTYSLVPRRMEIAGILNGMHLIKCSRVQVDASSSVPRSVIGDSWRLRSLWTLSEKGVRAASTFELTSTTESGKIWKGWYLEDLYGYVWCEMVSKFHGFNCLICRNFQFSSDHLSVLHLITECIPSNRIEKSLLPMAYEPLNSRTKPRSVALFEYLFLIQRDLLLVECGIKGIDCWTFLALLLDSRNFDFSPH